jgi:hypothetical protein
MYKSVVNDEDDIEEEARAGAIALPRAFSEILQVSAGNKSKKRVAHIPRRASLCLLHKPPSL